MIAISEHPMEETFTDQSSLRTVVESIDREGTIDSVSCTDSTPSSSTPSSPQLSKKRAIDPLAKKSKKPRHDPSGDVDKSNIIVNKEANRRGRAQKALIDPKAPKYLTKAPVWDLGSNLNALQQIKLFFSSPCPSLICGSDQDQPFLCGALMEFRLREMLDCEIGGDLKDLVSYGGISNIPVERAMIVFEKAKDYEIPLPIANFRQWGRKSEQLARVWDGPLADLYYKKTYLTKGIYSDPNVVLKSKQTRFYSDEDFKFPLPEVFPAESDFELSYDLEYMVDELGGTAGMNGSSETEKPSKFQWIPKNIFVDRKPRKDDLPPVCMCKVGPGETVGCGSTCLNRCLYIECADNCPTGKKCSNKRFQTRGTADFANTLQVKATPGRGFGLEATKAIPKDTFVMEYRGEIISLETSLKRNHTVYKFSKHHYFLNYGYNEVIDGHQKGTIARFANHSCDPTCRIEKWKVDGEYRYGVFARKSIQPGDEISYDYKFQSFGPMQECACGTEKCRGYIGVKPTTTLTPAAAIEATKRVIQRAKKPFQNPAKHAKPLLQSTAVDESLPKSNRSLRAENREYQREDTLVFRAVHDDIEENDGTFLMTFKGSLVRKERYDAEKAAQFLNKRPSAKPFAIRNLKASKRIPGFAVTRKPIHKDMPTILQKLETTAIEKQHMMQGIETTDIK